PFLKLRGLDPAPGPEMKSTGEVMGSDITAEAAYLKARMATEIPIPLSGAAYLTVRSDEQDSLIPFAKELENLKFKLYATKGTADTLRSGGIEVETVYRIAEGKHPDALDLMRKGVINFVVNVPTVTGGAVRDGNMMRRMAVELNIPFVTTLSGVKMEVAAIKEARKGPTVPRPLEVSYLNR
ncbi:uncharacterized protein METZ01_LOCUS494714, partial [marine metagenome]